MAPERPPVLLYDGECAFCRRWVRRLRLIDRSGRLECLPAGERHQRTDLPALDDRALDRAVHLILSDGTVLTGARALPAALRLTGWPLTAALFRVPGVTPIADRVYRWVAARRHRMGCGPDGCGRSVLSSQRHDLEPPPC